jgi:uncharacterized membrane-anchored protein YjiN (DUF445 family)
MDHPRRAAPRSRGAYVAAVPAHLDPDAVRAGELRSMKRRATGLLVVVAALFAWLVLLRRSSPDVTWLAYAVAAAEGSMVGGLADWFAVTALFRHPLGLPIPHTAVIRERKDQFGATLGDFVQSNFLNADVVAERLRSSHVPARVAAWASSPENAARVAGAVAEALVAVVDAVRDEDVHRFLDEETERFLTRVDAAGVAADVLRVATRDGRHREVLDMALRGAASFLDDQREPLRDRFGEQSPWWLPGAVEDRIFDRLLDGAVAVLRHAADDPAHELRASIEARLAQLAVRLETDAALRSRVEAFVHDTATSPDLRAWLASMWSDAREALRASAASPGSRLRERLAGVVVAGGERLSGDAALQDKLAGAAESAVRHVVTHHGDEIGSLISSTIARWDADETSRKLELLLGRDLQFIRINGTVVGGLAGVAIHAVGELLLRR